MDDNQYIDYRYNMDLADVSLFRTIASLGSLSAAARRLGTTPMLVSRRLAGLEAELGVRLFHRTTRSLSLTPEGEAFLPHALALLDARDAALDSISSGATGIAGVLKLTTPHVVGHSLVVPVVAKLISHNPGLRVDLTLSDGVIDIATVGLDVAVRLAATKPSDLISTKVAGNPFLLCASPDYIARFGAPATTQDLVSHPCIQLHALDAWPFMRDGEVQRVRTSGPFAASTLDAVRAACVAGVGLAMLTYWDVHEHLARGALQSVVLSDVDTLEVGIWAVFPTRTQMPPRVRAFIDAFRDYCLSAPAGSL